MLVLWSAAEAKHPEGIRLSDILTAKADPVELPLCVRELCLRYHITPSHLLFDFALFGSTTAQCQNVVFILPCPVCISQPPHGGSLSALFPLFSKLSAPFFYPPPHCAHSPTHYSIWCNYIKSTEKKGPHSKKTFLQTNSFEEIQELLNQELTSFCSRACPANRQPSRVKCCLRAPSGGTQTPTPPCLPTGGLWGFFPPHFSLFASGDSGTGITDSTTILSYLLALSKKFSSFEETIYNNGENPRTGCVGGGPRDSPAPTIPTTGCYLGQSQAAVSHLLMQRRDPAWSASLRSGCSLSAVFYPAWLTVLTSTPPYPSHFPCTSAVPVGAMRINVIPVGVTDEMYWEVFPFPTARHWAWY